MLHNKLKITVGFIQKIKITILFIVVSILLLMVSCKKDEETLDSGKVSFFFNHKIGLQELEFDNLKYINAYDTQSDLLIGANPILHKEILKKINHKN